MGNNRKEVSINLCRKVGCFLLERENGLMQSPLIAVVKNLLLHVVDSPRIREIKSLHVGIDVMLTENNCTHHNNVNADLKTNLLV